MGNKRNKVLRRICTRKRRNKSKKPYQVSQESKDYQCNNSTTSLTRLTAVTPILTDISTVQEADHGETTVNDPSLEETVSQEDACLPIHGRRIIHMMDFIQQLQKISSHSSLFNCNFKDMSLIGESRNGLISKYKFKCNMCKKDFLITSEDPAHTTNVNANLAAVTGITSAGIGYSQFQEITACMDIPIFSEITYSKIQDTIYEKWEEGALESMEKAAMRERDAAIAEGKLSKDSIPIVDVYADGVWSSRSYGNNYKALSGAAAIVGRKFGEVLYIGIKNKYCLVCARADKKQISTPDHVCFKNFTGPSSSMEAEIICQGFETSIEMYDIIYGRLIADGDSATYAKILARNPYPNHNVQKIECRNHLLRNMCNKLRALTKDTKYPLEYRKTLSEIKIMSIRKVVITSIQRYKFEKEKPESIISFRKDVENSIYHAFGNHEQCQNYYCTKDKIAQSNIEIENTMFWFRIKTIIQSITSKSKSLLEDVDTNIVECFNSIVAKIVGGKRINFSLRRGYRARCSAAVLAFNNPHPRHTLHKKMLGRSPKSILKKFEERRLKKRKFNQAKPHKKNRVINRISNNIQHDYGAQSTTPDMPPHELVTAKELFLTNLKQLTLDKDKIQLSTINQRDSNIWLELRKNMLTASNFGIVVKRRETSSKAKLVQNILYKSNLSNVTAIAHGIENEQLALQQLAKQENVRIESCGLFVDDVYPFLGATPDGLIGQNTIVEIKCPLVAFKNGLENAIKANKVQIWRYDKKTNLISLNKNSTWYYQIQGQLHVTRKQKCLFAVWSGENNPLKKEIIERCDVFWETKMKEKLLTFYMDWLLPEIVDSRQARGMPLREKESLSIRTIDDFSQNHDHQQNESCRKRRLSFTESPTAFSFSSHAYIENEPCNKRPLTSVGSSTLLSTTFDENKENMPCCSRQLTFDEM